MGWEVDLRYILDHCHVWIISKVIDLGPKPVRFIRGWFDPK